MVQVQVLITLQSNSQGSLQFELSGRDSCPNKEEESAFIRFFDFKVEFPFV